jgi:hypothetical protein
MLIFSFPLSALFYTLIRTRSGQSLGNFKKAMLFEESQRIGEKISFTFFMLVGAEKMCCC